MHAHTLRSEHSDGQMSVIETNPVPGVAPPLNHNGFLEATQALPDVTTVGHPITENGAE